MIFSEYFCSARLHGKIPPMHRRDSWGSRNTSSSIYRTHHLTDSSGVRGSPRGLDLLAVVGVSCRWGITSEAFQWSSEKIKTVLFSLILSHPLMGVHSRLYSTRFCFDIFVELVLELLMTGPIQPDLGKLAALEKLDLNKNQLSGKALEQISR